MFGEESFDARQYALSFFKKHSVDAAEAHCRELSTLKNAAENHMRKVVSDNYLAFMRASEDIKIMEERIANVRVLLEATEDTLLTLETVRLDAAMAMSGDSPRAEDPYGAPAADGLGLGGGGGGSGGMKLPQWLRAAPEELEECILERHYSGAEQLVRRVRQFESQISDPSALGDETRAIFSRVGKQALKLARRLLREVDGGEREGSRVWGFRSREHNYRLLSKLGFGDAAADAFLRNCKDNVRRALSSVDVGGDVVAHAAMLCRAFVAIAASSTRDFMSLFSEPSSNGPEAGEPRYTHAGAPGQHMSWVEDELEHFCGLVGDLLASTWEVAADAGAADLHAAGAESFDPLAPAGTPHTPTYPPPLDGIETLTSYSSGPPSPILTPGGVSPARRKSSLTGSLSAEDQSAPASNPNRRSLSQRTPSFSGADRPPSEHHADSANRRRRASARVRRRSMLSGVKAHGGGDGGGHSQAAVVRRVLLVLVEGLRPLADLGLPLWPRVAALLLPRLHDFVFSRVRAIEGFCRRAVERETWDLAPACLQVAREPDFGALRSAAGPLVVEGDLLRSTAACLAHVGHLLAAVDLLWDLGGGSEAALAAQPLYPIAEDVLLAVAAVLEGHVRLLEDAARPPDAAEARRGLAAGGLEGITAAVLPAFSRWKDGTGVARLERAFVAEEGEGTAEAAERALCVFDGAKARAERLAGLLAER